jgi:hypothetical protein
MIRSLGRAWAKARNVIGAVPSIRSTYITADRQFHLLRELAWATAVRADPRHQDPKSVVRHGFKVYSQNDEDGILEAIFDRVAVGGRRFAEIGVGNGLENNTAYLLQKGWSGGWLDADPAAAAHIRTAFAPLLAAGRLAFREAFVTAEGADDLLAGLGAGADPDLLSLDIDGNEWWVWKHLRRCRPRVVVVEYNAGMGPSLSWVMPYDPAFRNPGTRAAGASLKAFEQLGREKGYRLVGCNWTGVNAFFVREDVAGDRFPDADTAEYHFEPPRYFAGPFYGGYPADPREFAGRPAAGPGAGG